MLPSNNVSISCCVGVGFDCNRLYMFITKPELQNPHCDPLYSASVVEIGLYCPADGLQQKPNNCVESLPFYNDRSYVDNASIVVTDEPSTLHNGRRH
jgi:hypothetical protein